MHMIQLAYCSSALKVNGSSPSPSIIFLTGQPGEFGHGHFLAMKDASSLKVCLSISLVIRNDWLTEIRIFQNFEEH
uniref:Uncharacterized protein n=1 Tax=Romanomermis culicivorax TaxID=13658 RepID=A0A915JG85_ROMCU